MKRARDGDPFDPSAPVDDGAPALIGRAALPDPLDDARERVRLCLEQHSLADLSAELARVHRLGHETALVADGAARALLHAARQRGDDGAVAMLLRAMPPASPAVWGSRMNVG